MKDGLSTLKIGHFKNILDLFCPLKSKLSNFCTCLIFIFNKKEPQIFQFYTFFYKNNFIRTKTLVLTKKLRTR